MCHTFIVCLVVWLQNDSIWRRCARECEQVVLLVGRRTFWDRFHPAVSINLFNVNTSPRFRHGAHKLGTSLARSAPTIASRQSVPRPRRYLYEFSKKIIRLSLAFSRRLIFPMFVFSLLPLCKGVQCSCLMESHCALYDARDISNAMSLPNKHVIFTTAATRWLNERVLIGSVRSESFNVDTYIIVFFKYLSKYFLYKSKFLQTACIERIKES